jgi:hypothetical protein
VARGPGVVRVQAVRPEGQAQGAAGRLMIDRACV